MEADDKFSNAIDGYSDPSGAYDDEDNNSDRVSDDNHGAHGALPPWAERF